MNEYYIIIVYLSYFQQVTNGSHATVGNKATSGQSKLDKILIIKLNFNDF